MKRKRNYWSKEIVQAEANKYAYRNDFLKGSSGAYHAAYRNGWLNDVCSHMEDTGYGRWTREACLQEALRYKTRTEFKIHSAGAYSAASKKRWLKEICNHMEPAIKNNRPYCVYVVKNERLKKAYIGITSQTFSVRIGKHKKDGNNCLSKEVCRLDDTVFEQLTPYNFITIEAQKKEQEFCSFYSKNGWTVLNEMRNVGYLGSNIKKWTKEDCIKRAKDFKFKDDFHKKESGAYDACKRNGWLDDVCAHMPRKMKWNKELCHEKAKKYQTRKDFERGDSGAYQSALTHNWLDSICTHMKSKVIWTKEVCKNEALRYTKRGEFRRNSSGAYNAAGKKGWLTEITSHME